MSGIDLLKKRDCLVKSSQMAFRQEQFSPPPTWYMPIMHNQHLILQSASSHFDLHCLPKCPSLQFSTGWPFSQCLIQTDDVLMSRHASLLSSRSVLTNRECVFIFLKLIFLRIWIMDSVLPRFSKGQGAI